MYKEKCVQYIIGTLCLALLSLALQAASPSALIMADPLGARPLALGNAFSALADDESAIATNPAGLIRSKHIRIAAAHLQGLLDTSTESLMAVMPMGNYALGLQVASLSDIDQRRDEFGNYQGEFSSSNLLAGAAWSTRMGRLLTAGVGIKAVHERYDNLEQTSAAADIGLQLKGGAWGAGFHAQNLGAKLSGNSIEDEGSVLPLRISAAISRQAFVPTWQNSLQITGMPNEDRLRLSAGSELWLGFPESQGLRLALRAGYQVDLLQEDVGRASVGAGFQAPPYLELNYALINFGQLGTAHRFTLAVTLPSFKTSVPPAAWLKPVYNLKVVAQTVGVMLQWDDPNPSSAGYHIYTDYGHYDEQLTPTPVQGRSQQLIEVERGRTYNFYVAAVGSDGKTGAISEVLTWTATK